jgi:hypothetical protein
MAARDASRVPAWVEPMLAMPDGGRLRSGPEWAYEYKLDFCTRFGAGGAESTTRQLATPLQSRVQFLCGPWPRVRR